jgi:hypothetical protein
MGNEDGRRRKLIERVPYVKPPERSAKAAYGADSAESVAAVLE